MKKLILLLALCVGFSLSAVAQYGSSSSSGGSSPSASQGSSSSTSTDQATTSTKSKKKSKEGAAEGASTKEHTVTGCLGGPNADGAYVLTNGRYKKGLEVGGSDELKNHVGHEVKLTGTWASASDMGETGGGTTAKGEKSESKQKHMKVSKVEHISETCTSAKASKTKGGSKKEKGSSSTSTPPSM